MSKFSQARRPGFKSVYQRKTDDGLVYAVLTRSNIPSGASSTFIVEVFTKDGEPSKTQPRELWEGLWDTDSQAIEAIKNFLGESESL